MPDFDFGFDRGNSKGNDNPAPADNKTDLDTGNVGKDGITGLDNAPVAPDTNPDPTPPAAGNDPKPEPKPEPKPDNKPEPKPDVKRMIRIMVKMAMVLSTLRLLKLVLH